MKTLLSSPKADALRQKSTNPLQISVLSRDRIHPLNTSQTGNISATTMTLREQFIVRVSGKVLREKVRK